MASSRSISPPVWPSPRAEIIGMCTPQAATSGATIRLTFSSPTPPLECLSMIVRPPSPTVDQSTTFPESRMASAKAIRSSRVMPLS